MQLCNKAIARNMNNMNTVLEQHAKAMLTCYSNEPDFRMLVLVEETQAAGPDRSILFYCSKTTPRPFQLSQASKAKLIGTNRAAVVVTCSSLQSGVILRPHPGLVVAALPTELESADLAGYLWPATPEQP